MAAIFRLGNRQILSQLRNEKLGMLSLVRPVTLKAQPATKEIDIGHDERNMQLGRPQSPHLTIYSFQLTSMLSITHRATGMMLAGYAIMWGTGAVVLPDTIPHYLDALQQAHVGGFVLSMGKFMLAFPMCYHFWNGIRHLAWDLGRFLTIKEVYATGYAMLALTVASAIALTSM
ncbi:Succinate dehydrogenase cytochrome b560 subunit, mitochondrial-like Protein [Tribolium castaneum]|uniref:Succinate dehydrogenase cytochrome b560 subunit, mitochondrial-like Protein n=1 Tax=Tribolium castaneum TaxID=7070 RepID=D6W9H7_TRICA|nr:PREDICTED: succinate dehydrogenase cytochrome b560 subunit, mitochondrial isoform X1 [Tribolium castaneum]EEZ99263.1 Succinate dehydrogenase cytochrome b560 subunit, mitochondrial-like Protein [Tribolium castaneum]|eukprot:XP_972413.1 PREDICTED: succinate dehydrogenase cytochrome b560 subunit, mitochondrial isoform X1 [Tribolium castaneum]